LNRYRFKVLWGFSKGHRLQFFAAFLFALAATGIGFINPQITGKTIDSVLGTQALELPQWLLTPLNQLGGVEWLRSNLWVLAVVVVGLAVVSGVINYFKNKMIAQCSEGMARSMKENLYKHLQEVEYDYHVGAETGDLIQRCTTDVETSRRFLAVQVIEFARIIIMAVLSFAILFQMHVGLTLLAMVLIPWLILFSYLYFKKIQKKFTEVETADGKLSTVMQENFTGVRVVRAFGREAFEREKFNEKNDDMRDKAYSLNKDFAVFWSVGDIFSALPTMVVTIAGLYLTVKGELTLGQLTIFFSYLGQMMWPIRQLGRMLADMGKTLIAVGRIDEILTLKPEDSGPNPQKPALNRDIVFEHVNFSYKNGKQVLHDLSFTVKGGETVGILGPTGSGKSTLMQLMQRLYEYSDGSIRIGETELNTIDKHHLRSRVGYVLQEPFLYSKTIKENIAITDPAVEDEKIFEVARVASVHDVITEFEEGYETVVGERGVTLSGGQKQRVAIARTLLPESDILIFDDSLSAVDTQTDAQIREALRARRAGTTTFIISHRLSTLMQADHILVLEDGHLTQEGTHASLLEEDGLYRRVWDIQNAADKEVTEA